MVKLVTLADARRILRTGTTKSEHRWHLTPKMFLNRLVGAICDGNQVIIPRKSITRSYNITLTDDSLEISEDTDHLTNKPKIPFKIVINNKCDIKKIQRAVFTRRMGDL